MKIFHLANIRLPTEKAHGLQIMKTCEAFAAEGNEVTLFVPSRRNAIKQDPYEFYVVSKTFSIVTIQCPDLIRFGSIGFVISAWIFGLLVTREVLRREFDWAFSRDGRTLWLLSWKSSNFIWEVHDDQRHWWGKRVLKKCIGLVTTNRALIGLHKEFVGEDIRALALPNGVTLSEFVNDKSKLEIRTELGLNVDKKIILYTGHLYTYKGADTLAEAAMQLPEHDFVFVGGMKNDVDNFREKYKDFKNIKVLGYKKHHEIPLYLKSADILVLPNSAKDSFSLLYTSPIKLFEYMASGTIIIASDIPSIREILDESCGYYFKPDDSNNLVETIRNVIKNPNEAEIKVNSSLEDIKKYSHKNRALNIIRFVQSSIK